MLKFIEPVKYVTPMWLAIMVGYILKPLFYCYFDRNKCRRVEEKSRRRRARAEVSNATDLYGFSKYSHANGVGYIFSYQFLWVGEVKK